LDQRELLKIPSSQYNVLPFDSSASRFYTFFGVSSYTTILMPHKKMANSKRTVLITGCSEGGMGAALAIAFHEAGLHVWATARDLSKMTHLSSLGIKTLELDIQSDSSITACVSKVSSRDLDILVNNAGASASMPISDLSIPEAKKIFDVNVWSQLSITQAFLPLLLKSKGMIVNQTSVVSTMAVPFQSAYNASKAAMAIFSDSMRLE
jgi:short-subunit dehydrogenase